MKSSPFASTQAVASRAFNDPRRSSLLDSLRSLRFMFVACGLMCCWGTRTLAAEPPKPLRVLLIAGGCCHEYDKQTAILKTGLEARAHVTVEIDYNPDRTTRARFARYERADWADAYDVIIHDECTSDVKEMPYVQRILDAHRRGKPAVNLHCAMHCYRTGTDDWFKFLGLHSTGHGPQKPIAVKHVDKEHPITKTLEDWTTVNEELYNNVRLFDTARPLARGIQDTGKKVDDYVVTWVNDYGSTRVFCTTLGHNTATVADPKYLELVTRGLLWSCDKLNDQYLKPTPPPAAASEGPQPTPAKRP